MSDDKQRQVDTCRVNQRETHLTTEQGVRIDHTDDSVTVGERGPTLLADFHAREKLTHFDHERIPERVVHARGAGAYGSFRPHTDWLAEYTTAEFLTNPAVLTPVFTRFSTVAGSRGSADTVRDVRGFATKFYTRQGNYDLVGNNIPVFFIQDGIKFPDFVHAVKPEPDSEIPQAQSAHDTFWDFVSLQPETMHMVMWLMSDRALPRSYRMMQGFGVHTFRLINSRGRGTFVKFHWKPALGVHSLVWDECQKIAGRDPDFNRRDLWEVIESGAGAYYELGVQLVDEADEDSFDFDLLDATKIIPEEQVPVRPVGTLVLNRNPDNFFAETEQVAFHTANVVPGIDFTNDPLLQARNFSYLDTQLIRLGGPNFAQIPVNRPVALVSNDHRDGYHQHRIHQGRASYLPNTLGGGCPAVGDGAYTHYQEKVEGTVIRRRSKSFGDHYGQATLFWNSMSMPEREHIVAAFRFELNKVGHRPIRQAVVDQLNHVDHELAGSVARGVGVVPPAQPVGPNHGRSSPALSQLGAPASSIATRKVAFLVADGVDGVGTRRVIDGMTVLGAVCDFVGLAPDKARAANGHDLIVDHPLETTASVLYDAVVVPCGPSSVEALAASGDAVHFVAEAFKHRKPVAAFGTGVDFLAQASIVDVEVASQDAPVVSDRGVVTTVEAGEELSDVFVSAVIATLAAHRAWDRETAAVPA